MLCYVTFILLCGVISNYSVGYIIHNVAALFIKCAYFMRFFLIRAGTKKGGGLINALFWAPKPFYIKPPRPQINPSPQETLLL